MLIWLGVVETVLALTGIVVAVFLYLLIIKLHQVGATLHRTQQEFAEAVKRDAGHRERDFDRHAERIEVSNKEVLAGVKSLREAWESLSTEIRTRYQNYDKAQRLALRQIQAVEFLEKTMKNIVGKVTRPVNDNISNPGEADAAAMEQLTDAEKLERMAMASAAAGLDGNEFDTEG